MDGEQARVGEHVLFSALDALVHGETAPWAEMFHDDGVMEFPFAPPGYPPRLDGKAAIAAFMRAYPEHVSLTRVFRTGVYHSGDTLIAEFVGEGMAVPTGAAFVMPYVAVVTFDGGKVRRYRDYWDPVVALRALGGLDAVRALGGEGARS